MFEKFRETVADFRKLNSNIERIELRDKKIKSLENKIMDKVIEMGLKSFDYDEYNDKQKKILTYLNEMKASSNATLRPERYLERLEEIWNEINEV